MLYCDWTIVSHMAYAMYLFYVMTVDLFLPLGIDWSCVYLRVTIFGVIVYCYVTGVVYLDLLMSLGPSLTMHDIYISMYDIYISVYVCTLFSRVSALNFKHYKKSVLSHLQQYGIEFVLFCPLTFSFIFVILILFFLLPRFYW